MVIFISWFAFSFVVGLIGTGRKIGFGAAFLLSLLLSPLLGIIITLSSKSDSQAKFEQQTLDLQRQQIEAASSQRMHSTADELRKLKTLYDEGALTEAEFDLQKAKLLSR